MLKILHQKKPPRPDCWAVCMTTTPDRLTSPFFGRVLNSIFAQQCAPDFKLLLFVPPVFARTGQAYPDPGFLLHSHSNGRLQIHRCPDYGPATKFLGLRTLLSAQGSDLAPFTHVYIADDDIILHPNAFNQVQRRSVQRWWQRQRPTHTVWANSVAHVANIKMAEGFAGILIPVAFFCQLYAQPQYDTVWNALQQRKHPCLTVDDVLLSRLLGMHGYTIRHTGLNAFTQIMNHAATDEHPDWFELCKHDAPRNASNLICVHTCLPLPATPREPQP